MTVYGGDLAELVGGVRTKKGLNIYCDGGAELVDGLLRQGLIDEMILSVVPVLLGGGTPLFREGRQMEEMALVGSRTYETGLVQLHYRLRT